VDTQDRHAAIDSMDPGKQLCAPTATNCTFTLTKADPNGIS
jgi:hypothetical protein